MIALDFFDRTSILSVDQAVYRPNTPFPRAFSTFACTMQDVVWSNQALLDHGIHGCKEYRLSFLQEFCPPAVNLNLWWSVN